jgi:hypothetical protein
MYVVIKNPGQVSLLTRLNINNRLTEEVQYREKIP